MDEFKPKLLFFSWFFLLALGSNAQEDSLSKINKVISFPSNLFSSINIKSQKLSKQLDQYTEKHLSRLSRQEIRLKKKLAKRNSALSQELFGNIDSAYAKIRNSTNPQASSPYMKHLDSLSTALNFLEVTSHASLPTLNSLELQKALDNLKELQHKFNISEQVKSKVILRRKMLQDQLLKHGMIKEFLQFRKQAYYYQARIQEYRQMIEDPSKLEGKLMELVVSHPKFREFFCQNSMLGSLFALPGSGAGSTASLQGLQTRASVNQQIVDRFGSGASVTQALQQNVQSAQSQLASFQNRINIPSNGSMGNSSEVVIPEFKPNNQKTKSFFKRLEYGMNMQSQKARYVFPVTSDIGLSLGYKLNERSTLGIGAAYKLGWGTGWDNIRISHQGVGLRSYLDWKLKGSLFISGGYEMNYRNLINSVDQLRDYSAWQRSGLVGLSKKYKLNKKLKGEMKLLWDFLSHQQIPRTQAFVFRVGYSLK